MRTSMTFFVFFATAALFSLNGHAENMVASGSVSSNFHANLTPGNSIIVSVTNQGDLSPAKNPSARCNNVEGTFRFFGTAAPQNNGEDGVKKLNLLAKVPFALRPGEVRSVEFLQASMTNETVIVDTVVPSNAKHCLALANTTVLDGERKLVSVVPQSSSPSDIFEEINITVVKAELFPSCCACVPVCGCGYCAD